MSTLRVLLPPFAVATGDTALSRWLARGDRIAAVPGGRDAALRRHFRFAGSALPVAALRHHGHAGVDDHATWMCADPAWVRADTTGARLLACPVADLGAGEAEQLVAALQPLFGDVGAPLAMDTPTQWCARLAPGASLGHFVAPADVLGADILAHLPGGNASRMWRRLFNDAQIALHAHPVNAARSAAGKQPVNAVWLWGAGTLPESVESPSQVVASADDCVRGLAKVAGVLRVEPSPAALEAVPGSALLDLADTTAAAISGEWLTHFRAWLKTRRYRAIELDFADDERIRMRHAHRLRFWRRG